MKLGSKQNGTNSQRKIIKSVKQAAGRLSYGKTVAVPTHSKIQDSKFKFHPVRPSGRAAVICDMDETIYPGATPKDAGRWLLEQGYLGPSIYLKIIWWLVLRKLHLLNHEQAFAEGVKHLAGWKLADLEAAMHKLYRDELKPHISPAVRAQVADWEREGDLVFATESLAIIARPMVEDLGGHIVLGTELEVVDGMVTGNLAGPVLRDQIKAEAITAWATTNGYDLAKSIAVGGRVEDEAMLALVGRPIMLNPDHAAQKLAESRGWQIVQTTS